MAGKARKRAPEGASEADGTDLGFDERLTQLEGLVAELEQGGLGLEDAIDRYGKGLELLKTCHASLAKYRAQVEELGRSAEGALEPFGGDPDVGDAAGR